MQIKKISGFNSLKLSRFILLFLLFPVFIYMAPTAEYIAIVIILLPFLLNLMFSADKKKEGSKSSQNISSLPTLTKRYRYSTDSHKAEKCAKPIILICLFLWQYSVAGGEKNIIIQVYPGILFIIYILTGIFINIIFRHNIHKKFRELKFTEK